MRLLLTSLLLCLALPAAAQIYQYKDANGNTVYTNQPPIGTAAQEVELPATNSIEMSTPDLPPDTSAQTSAGPIYKQLAVTGLPDDEALRANNGTFTVTILIDPRLAASHSLQLLLDGQPHGAASQATQLQVSNADRGEHSLSVQVLSGGKPIQSSAAVTFTIQRVSKPRPTPR